MMATKTEYEARIEKDTNGFHRFDVSRPEPVTVGGRYLFVYPDFGDPVGYPDHLAHRFHEVSVIGEADCPDGEMEWNVRADDGWTGVAFDSELFPLTLQEYESAVGK